jgi:hypothetical protein
MFAAFLKTVFWGFGTLFAIGLVATIANPNKSKNSDVGAVQLNQHKTDPYANVPRITVNEIQYLGDQFREPLYLLEANFLGISKLTTDLHYQSDSRLMHIIVQDKNGSIFSHVSMSKEIDGRKLVDMAYGQKIKILGRIFKLHTKYNTIEYFFTGVLAK